MCQRIIKGVAKIRMRYAHILPLQQSSLVCPGTLNALATPLPPTHNYSRDHRWNEAAGYVQHLSVEHGELLRRESE